jgi:hypothetical protein
VSPALSPEVEEVLERAAALRHGLGFLHTGPLESVAITLGLDARLVARVRGQIDDPSLHPLVIESFKRAVERQRAGERPAAVPAPPPPAPAMGPADLLRAAEAHPLGLPFLADAPLETVAVTFGVTPFVVLEARALLARAGPAVKRPD